MTPTRKKRARVLFTLMFIWQDDMGRDGMTIPFMFKLYCKVTNIKFTVSSFKRSMLPILKTHLNYDICGGIDNLVVNSVSKPYRPFPNRRHVAFYEKALEAIAAGNFNWAPGQYKVYATRRTPGSWNKDTEELDEMMHFYTSPHAQDAVKEEVEYAIKNFTEAGSW